MSNFLEIQNKTLDDLTLRIDELIKAFRGGISEQLKNAVRDDVIKALKDEIELNGGGVSGGGEVVGISEERVKELINEALVKLSLNVDLSEYALKSEIPNIDNLATKDEIKDFVSANELDLFDDKADRTELLNYALKSDLDLKANKDEIPQLPNFDEFAKKDELPSVDLSDYALKTELPQVDLSGYATKEELANVASGGQVDLSNYALKSEIVQVDLTNYALKDEIPDISNLALKSEIPQIDLTNYALKSELPDISNLATKDEIPQIDLSNYATKDDLANLNQGGNVDLSNVLDLSSEQEINAVKTFNEIPLLNAELVSDATLDEKAMINKKYADELLLQAKSYANLLLHNFSASVNGVNGGYFSEDPIEGGAFALGYVWINKASYPPKVFVKKAFVGADIWQEVVLSKITQIDKVEIAVKKGSGSYVAFSDLQIYLSDDSILRPKSESAGGVLKFDYEGREVTGTCKLLSGTIQTGSYVSKLTGPLYAPNANTISRRDPSLLCNSDALWQIEFSEGIEVTKIKFTPFAYIPSRDYAKSANIAVYKGGVLILESGVHNLAGAVSAASLNQYLGLNLLSGEIINENDKFYVKV